MSIQRAEQLKREWTDKHVMVQNGVPELRRFDGLVGQVKTVNMNCRLLIEFDTPADISWYDIDPQFVKVVDKGAVNAAAAAAGDASSSASATAVSATGARQGSQAANAAGAGSTVPSGSGGGSPLDKIRQQAAGGAGSAEAATAGGGSPLDKIRQQAAGGAGSTEAASAGGGSPLDKIRQQSAGGGATAQKSGGSPLDQIRQQAAGESAGADTAASPSKESETASGASGPTNSSPLDQIRAQAGGGASLSEDSDGVDASSGSGDSAGTSEKPKASGSPLDQIRAQASGAATSTGNEAASTETASREGNEINRSDLDSVPTSGPLEEATPGGSPLDQIRAQHAAGENDSTTESENSGAATATTSGDAGASNSPTSDDKSLPDESSQPTPASLLSTPKADATEEASAPNADSPNDDGTTESTASAAIGTASSGTTPFDQVRQQAESSDGDAGSSAVEATPIFDQIKQQAADDDKTGREDSDASSDEARSNSELTPASGIQQSLFDSSAGAEAGTAESADGKSDSSNHDEELEEEQTAGGALPSEKDIVGIEDPVNATYRGKKLPKKDDLKIVEGIGPKIEQLFRDDGIQTWTQLGDANPDRLRKILEDAGPRFRMHNPETWPGQAKMASEGQWQKLEEYQNQLDGGRPPEKP